MTHDPMPMDKRKFATLLIMILSTGPILLSIILLSRGSKARVATMAVETFLADML